MVNIAICDNDKKLILNLEKVMKEISYMYRTNFNIESFDDGISLKKSILRGNKYDLIYISDYIKDEDSIEVGKFIRNLDLDVLIIYLLNSKFCKSELFEVEPFRVLSKPINKQLLEKYYLSAVKRIESKVIYFTYKFNREIYKVKIDDIMFFESKKRSIIISFKDGTKSVYYDKLNEVEKNLKDIGVVFIRVHQSFLVNYKYIKIIRNVHVELLNGTILPMSQFRQKEVYLEYGQLNSYR